MISLDGCPFIAAFLILNIFIHNSFCFKHHVVRVANWGDAGFIKIETNSAQSWAWVELGELINKGSFFFIYFLLYIQHLFIVLYNIYSMYYTYTVLKQELD